VLSIHFKDDIFSSMFQCVLTHSYSRVVMAVLKAAVMKGKMCMVYVTMSEPDKSG
jgi:translation initiation factor 2B subunit (eIF-2B alpha/beta/delta family)